MTVITHSAAGHAGYAEVTNGLRKSESLDLTKVCGSRKVHLALRGRDAEIGRDGTQGATYQPSTPGVSHVARLAGVSWWPEDAVSATSWENLGNAVDTEDASE